MSRGPSPGYLMFISTAAGLGGFLFGFDAVVVSGVVPLVEKQFGLGAGIEGLLVAAAVVGCMVSAPVTGVFADRYGRRPSLFVAGFVTVTATLISAFAPNVAILAAARFIGGIGIGVASMVCPLYLSEISPPKQRGLLVSLYQFAITIGIFASLLSNVWIAGAVGHGWLAGLVGSETWRAMFGVQVIPCVLFLMLCIAIPESPRMLFRHGQVAEARALFASLLPADEVESTLVEVAAELEVEKRQPGTYRELFQLRYYRPLEIALLLAAFSQLSGISVVFFYGPTVLNDAGFVLGDALGGVAVIGLVNMVATVAALWLIDRVGRRPLLLWGTAGAILSLLATGTLLARGNPVPHLLVLTICAFVACYAMSLGPVKFVVAAEIFPNAVRARAGAVFISFAFAADTVVNLAFPLIRKAFGAEASFFLCAALVAPQILYVLKRVPETAGKSLERIQLLWATAPEEG